MGRSIIEIANIIRENGGCLYLVGGAVRDEILGIKNYDEDYCVTGISHEEFILLFPESFCRGKTFEVFDIDGKEFALARTEKKTGHGHKEFDVKTGKEITILEDLYRRDITINSIAKNILTGEIIDPYNGIKDLKDGVIRATSDCFSEDPLRAYRAARFACKFGFKVEEKTLKKMNALKGELSDLSAERVFDELRKALSYEKPSIFFNVLKDADILNVHFIEVARLIGALQPIDKHPEGDSYNHTMAALDKCATLTDDVKIRYSVLVHDLGKGLTPKEEYPHHYGHDIKGVPEVHKLSSRLKVPKEWEDFGKVSAKEHMTGGIFYKMTPAKQVSFIERISKARIGLEGMEIVVESDKNCRGYDREIVRFAKLGNYLIQSINGNLVKSKFKISDGIKLREKIHEQRIALLKELYDSGRVIEYR